jgi:hypothetical protein
MNTTEVKILLEKYYEGQTTLQEERYLKTYLLSPEADPQFAAEARMFGHLAKAKQETLPTAVAEKIKNRMVQTLVLPFYRTRKFWSYTTGIAATLLIFFTVAISFYRQPSDRHFVTGKSYTRAETEVAMLQTQQALAYVGAKFTQGTRPLKQIDKLESTQTTMRNLGKLDRNVKTVSRNMDKASQSLDDLEKLSKFKIVIN